MRSGLAALAEAWFNDLKFKIINFDIKPAKPIISELLEQSKAAINADNAVLAESILQKILILNKNNLDALVTLSYLYLNLGIISKAAHMFRRAIKQSPNDAGLYRALGELYFYQGKYKASARVMQRVLVLCPEEIQLKHLIDSRLGHTTPKASACYITSLFDEYAGAFEDSLVGVLEYKAHIELVNYLRKKVGVLEPIESVLDLGCGTGLLGQEIARQFRINKLVGVDLSPNMLELSRVKNIYQELHNVDLIVYLQQTAPDIDLIVSSDVLIYLGDLEPVIAGCYRCLKPGGYLCFSLELKHFGGYKLTTTGRYKHSLSYIKLLYKKYHFSRMYSQAIDLRKESGNMVKGYLVLLQK